MTKPAAGSPPPDKRMTFKGINKILKTRPGYAGEELVQGEGYLYFTEGNASAWRGGSSIYGGTRLNHFSLDLILGFYDDAVREHAERMAAVDPLTKQQRTQAVIDGFRGLPNEEGMLKGLMCVEHVMQRAYEAAGLRFIEANAAASINLDTLMIAQRMDELRASILAGK